MTQEEKELLLKDLCARLPYGVRFEYNGQFSQVLYETNGMLLNNHYEIEKCKPYLRPKSSMTEEEAKELSILYGFKDILSTRITDKYIEFVVDDGFCSTETRTIWYDGIISSIEIFDWLNAHHFDFRNLIERGLAIDCTDLNVY